MVRERIVIESYVVWHLRNWWFPLVHSRANANVSDSLALSTGGCLMKYVEIWWNLMKSDEIRRNLSYLMKSHDISWNLMKAHEISWNLMKSHEFWLKQIKSDDTYEILKGHMMNSDYILRNLMTSALKMDIGGLLKSWR